MQPMTGQGALLSYAIPAVVIAAVVALRWRRMGQVKPLKLERLWIFPTIYAVACGVLYARFPPSGWGWLFCAVALAVGGALGWQRGRAMRITVDPETHALGQTGSPAAMLFLVLLVVVRSGARSLAGDGFLHLDAMAVTDVLMALALGLFTAQRLEMFLRARALLARTRRG